MPPRALTDIERRDWLRLIRSENVGPITFFHLLRRFGSAAAALDALPELSRRGGRARTLAVYPKSKAEDEIAALARLGARLVAHGEAEYPPPLAAIEDAPPLIAIKGHGHLARRPAVAVVGARNASANGVRFARHLAAELGAAGLVVASGLARGIDTAAHVGALDSGTIAVLAGGIDIVYPPDNETLQGEIGARGLLLTEMPPGTVPTATHFPRRNRLISGAALGLVVVEAARRSGSLITARLALEQGREVFAVPGSPLDPRAQGANQLIRSGATLIESADEIVHALKPLIDRPLGEPTFAWEQAVATPSADDAGLEAARKLILEKLAPTPTPVDEIIRQCQLSAATVLTVLLELELAGRLSRHPGNQVSLQ